MNRSKLLLPALVAGFFMTLTEAEAGAGAQVASAALTPTSAPLYTNGTVSAYQVSRPGPRLPLSAASVASMSRQDLLIGGYPLPKGDPSSATYSSWLQEVSQPFTVEPGAPLIPTNARFTTQTSESANIWSGIELQHNTPVPYVEVFGEWVVPAVAISNFNTYAGEWVGIDGDGCTGTSRDLLQLGTATFCVSEARQPWAWVQFIPVNPGALSLTNWITISALDTVSVETFYGDQQGLPTTQGPIAFFLFDNQTTGKSTGWLVESGGGNTILGATAEAIIENAGPSFNSSSPFLADTGNSSISMLAVDENGTFHDFNTDNTVVVDMCTTNDSCNSVNCTEAESAWQSNADTASFEWWNWN